MNQGRTSPDRGFRLRPDSRICIIGAGPAGLSAACYLRDKGCGQITILEREAYPGGKCLSLAYGDCIVEMGAVFASDTYETTLDLMGRVGMKPARSRKMAMPAGKTDSKEQYRAAEADHPEGIKEPKKRDRRKLYKNLMKKGYYPMEYALSGYFSKREAVKLLLQILKYRRLSKGYDRLYRPGLDGLNEHLHAAFSSWVEEHRMTQFAKMIEIPCTTFGYGYFEEIPAAYVLKYMSVPFILSMIFQKRLFHWEEGVQTLWKRLAAGFDVRYKTSPESILRGDRVVVRTGEESLAFDVLILTAPLDDSLGYLDARPEEKELFSRIKTYDYHVYCLEVLGLPISNGFKPVNFSKDRAGRMMIWSRRSRRQNLYTFYTIGGPSITEAGIRENLREEIADMGGRMEAVRALKVWKYFPHVEPETMAAGFYERLEGLQGKFRTFYAGELMSFSTIEHSVRYSRDLVERFFSTGGGGLYNSG